MRANKIDTKTKYKYVNQLIVTWTVCTVSFPVGVKVDFRLLTLTFFSFAPVFTSWVVGGRPTHICLSDISSSMYCWRWSSCGQRTVDLQADMMRMRSASEPEPVVDSFPLQVFKTSFYPGILHFISNLKRFRVLYFENLRWANWWIRTFEIHGHFGHFVRCARKTDLVKPSIASIS